MRYIVRGNEEIFPQLKSLTAEFSQVKVVNEMRKAIGIEGCSDELANKIKALGGKVYEDPHHGTADSRKVGK